eukprot:Nitzschia sp. Nitz4//scaffold378_size14206//221//1652//NITZ4_008946-RA/size14206-processed-gene-0.8-mRNA-1//1//CDS//3329549684//4370//frame0
MKEPPFKPVKGKVKGISLLLFLAMLAGLYVFVAIPLDTLKSYEILGVQQQLEDFTHPTHTDWGLNLTNLDPTEVYPMVVSPYHGPIDPFYNIPSDGMNLWDNDARIPEWAKAYFNWHKWRRKNWDPNRWADDRWLIMQCIDRIDSRCGGTADRLKPVPTLLRLAYQHRRMLLIHWTRPVSLDSFLVPPQGGFDWRVPDWLAFHLANETNGRRFIPSNMIQKYNPTNLTLMRTRYQSNNAGKDIYESSIPEGDPSFDQVFGSIWKVFFRPSPSVFQAIQNELTRMNLVPRQYISVHLRVLYYADARPVQYIQERTSNILKCASTLAPGAPMFFASDSADATEWAPKYAASQGGRAETHIPSPNPPLHLDRGESKDPSVYFDTFVDLYLLSLGKCVAHSKGGFGHWGLLIGGITNCTSRTLMKQTCPNWVSGKAEIDYNHATPLLHFPDPMY